MVLMRIDRIEARNFYEIEAIKKFAAYALTDLGAMSGSGDAYSLSMYCFSERG